VTSAAKLSPSGNARPIDAASGGVRGPLIAKMGMNTLIRRAVQGADACSAAKPANPANHALL
jgi:hypothetical protein